jgi:hypothetical protein
MGNPMRLLLALLVASGAIVVRAAPAYEPAIDLSRLIETFMTAPDAKPDWAMGAGPDTLELRWQSSGVEDKPDCGVYEACRKGDARVLINGKEMQQLRKRLEPVPWKLFMYSTHLGKFGPEAISIYPSCDAVHCTFDPAGELTRAGFKLTKLCHNMKDGSATTAFWIQSGRKASYLVVHRDAGSGGESVSLEMLFTKPADTKALCALDW